MFYERRKRHLTHKSHLPLFLYLFRAYSLFRLIFYISSKETCQIFLCLISFATFDSISCFLAYIFCPFLPLSSVIISLRHSMQEFMKQNTTQRFFGILQNVTGHFNIEIIFCVCLTSSSVITGRKAAARTVQPYYRADGIGNRNFQFFHQFNALSQHPIYSLISFRAFPRIRLPFLSWLRLRFTRFRII